VDVLRQPVKTVVILAVAAVAQVLLVKMVVMAAAKTAVMIPVRMAAAENAEVLAAIPPVKTIATALVI
jgi:hypothetical protein